MAIDTNVQAPVRGRVAFGATAILAGFGMALNLTLTALGTYPSTQTVPTLLGFNEPGLAGMPGRVFDFLSYFTILSNVVVVVVMAMLWRNPNRAGAAFRVLRLDALVMITVTGLIYWAVLAGSAELQGLEYVTNFIEHTLVPIVTVVVFLVFGPHGQFRVSTVFAALVLPIAWALVTLVRGATISAYPYGFINVAQHGYGSVLTSIAGVAVLGVIIGFVFLGLDRLRSRMQRAG
jgi:apolipoprotein N-acyltransferase